MQTITLAIHPVTIGKNKPTTRYYPHSLNHRLHPMVRYQWNKMWKAHVWYAFLENKHKYKNTPFQFAYVHITLRVVRYLDTDNAYSSVKPLLDGAKEAGIIVDDSPVHIALTVGQEKVKKRTEQGAVISIKDYDEK